MGGTTSNPTFDPGQRSPELGTWTQTGRSTYSAFDEALIIFSGGNSFTDDAKV
jgi:hypothetical protein